MNVLVAFTIELVFTVAASYLLVAYLGPSLFRILVDLCATEDRARFWLSFSKLLLVGAPTAAALAYSPQSSTGTALVFDLTRQLSGNLVAFLTALAVLGVILSVFAAIAQLGRGGKTA